MEKEGNTGTYTCTIRSTPDYLLLSFFFPRPYPCRNTSNPHGKLLVPCIVDVCLSLSKLVNEECLQRQDMRTRV